jgi:hypothetical protein
VINPPRRQQRSWALQLAAHNLHRVSATSHSSYARSQASGSVVRRFCAAVAVAALAACSGPTDGTGTATGTLRGPVETEGSEERFAVRFEAVGGVREFNLRPGDTYTAEGLPPMTYSVTSDVPGGLCPKSVVIRENETVKVDLTWPCSD